MKPQVPPPALRAARALLELSQQGAAEKAGTSLRSVQLAEGEGGTGEEVNSKLRAFYEAQGIVFLGTVEIGSGLISACGVRLRDPAIDSLSEMPVTDVPWKKEGVSFAAARAFLHLTKQDVSKGCGINRKTVGALEAGAGTTSTENYNKLLGYFEGQGIEFLGRRDSASRLFYGVGVRLMRPAAN